MESFINITEARNFIVRAINHYQEHNMPGWFMDWLDDLYIRLGEDWGKITLDEMATLANLNEENQWMMPHYAVNSVYKFFDRVGRSTVGMLSY